MGNRIITVNHEYGSGGKMIGKLLAEKLNLPVYDTEIISMTAKKSGFSEESVREAIDKKTNSFLYSIYLSVSEIPVFDKLFIAQSQVVLELASKKDCVIVGACADYVLREKPGLVKVFIHAPVSERIKRITEEYNENHSDMEAFLKKHDKQRADYYNYFTSNKWGRSTDYNLCIDSSVGINKTADIIYDYVTSL
jgi:cytidylate kinase